MNLKIGAMTPFSRSDILFRLINGYRIPNFEYRLGWGRTDRGLGLGLICQTLTQPNLYPFTNLILFRHCHALSCGSCRSPRDDLHNRCRLL